MPRVGDVQIVRGTLLKTLSDAAIVAQVVNHVAYIVHLEYGHSQQAPAGMLRVNLARIENAARVFLGRHMAENPTDPQRAMALTVAETAQFALHVLASSTPVDTGVAKLGWRVIGPYQRQPGG